jgi:glycosyltransferase involved in cell wall biosynthesis
VKGVATARSAAQRAVVTAVRLRARARLGRIIPGGVTIVTVNWNSVNYLRVLLSAVERFTTNCDVRVIVVDNASVDESREFLRSRPGVRVIRLPWNFGHPSALDVAFLMSETEFVIALDVDAFPIRGDWLDRLLDPLRSGSTISGARLNRSYVHPCCLAMRLERFVRLGHSFRSTYVPRHYRDGVLIDASGDVGEIMSARDGGPLHFLEVSSQFGPGDVGTVFGGVIYHNFYSTRFAAVAHQRLDGVVARDDPQKAWSTACQLYLGLRADDLPDPGAG